MISKKRKKQIEKWKARPFSWSQMSSWAYDRDQWFRKYILGIEEPPNTAMLFGNVVGKSFEIGEPMVPKIPLQEKMEYKIQLEMNGIPLIGYIDSWGPKTKILEEYKTSQNETKWHQQSVDEHGQLTFYGLLLLLQDNVAPESINMRLHYIPVRENGSFELELVNPDVFHSYSTARTTVQCLEFGDLIVKTRHEMEGYAMAAEELSD